MCNMYRIVDQNNNSETTIWKFRLTLKKRETRDEAENLRGGRAQAGQRSSTESFGTEKREQRRGKQGKRKKERKRDNHAA